MMACTCGEPNLSHPARHVVVRQWEACIDEELVDLIEALWRAGIATRECCQDWLDDGSRQAGVWFDASEFERFVALTCRDDYDPFWAQIFESEWEMDFLVGHNGQDWNSGVGLFFPVDDLPIILDRLAEPISN